MSCYQDHNVRSRPGASKVKPISLNSSRALFMSPVMAYLVFALIRVEIYSVSADAASVMSHTIHS